MTSDPLTRWIVSVDIENSGGRSDVAQSVLRRQVYDVVEFALARAGIDLGRGSMEDRGDGLLIVIDASTAPSLLLREFPLGLEDALAAFQRMSSDSFRMRLRVGLSHGAVVRAGGGWAGSDISDLARLVDSEPVRQAFARASRAHLALVVSDYVYRSAVQSNHQGTDQGAYAPTEVATRQGGRTLRGWVTIPGYPAPPEDLPDVRGGRPDEDSVTVLDNHVQVPVIYPPDGRIAPAGHTPPGPPHDPDDDWPRETSEP
ncbi:hypothetical protein [Streptomyces sp. NBC_00280]|uniref:hypothetical protein n=1 Tax=Streptomyces sp. NBC_00280 TaxID=2975699 RepID=UPI003249F4D4